MKDRIKKAMDHIEPSDAAKDRMYRNILKKASAQTEEKNGKAAFFAGAYRTVRPAGCRLLVYRGSRCDALFAGRCAG